MTARPISLEVPEMKSALRYCARLYERQGTYEWVVMQKRAAGVNASLVERTLCAFMS